MKCPHCNGDINPAKMLGAIKSQKRAEASRRNAEKARLVKLNKNLLNY